LYHLHGFSFRVAPDLWRAIVTRWRDWAGFFRRDRRSPSRTGYKNPRQFSFATLPNNLLATIDRKRVADHIGNPTGTMIPKNPHSGR
jgi:hypothetical protein